MLNKQTLGDSPKLLSPKNTVARYDGLSVPRVTEMSSKEDTISHGYAEVLRFGYP